MNVHCNFWYLVKELRFTVKLSGTNLLVNIQFLSVSLSLHAMFPSVSDRVFVTILPVEWERISISGAGFWDQKYRRTARDGAVLRRGQIKAR